MLRFSPASSSRHLTLPFRHEESTTGDVSPTLLLTVQAVRAGLLISFQYFLNISLPPSLSSLSTPVILNYFSLRFIFRAEERVASFKLLPPCGSSPLSLVLPLSRNTSFPPSSYDHLHLHLTTIVSHLAIFKHRSQFLAVLAYILPARIMKTRGGEGPPLSLQVLRV